MSRSWDKHRNRYRSTSILCRRAVYSTGYTVRQVLYTTVYVVYSTEPLAWNPEEGIYGSKWKSFESGTMRNTIESTHITFIQMPSLLLYSMMKDGICMNVMCVDSIVFRIVPDSKLSTWIRRSLLQDFRLNNANNAKHNRIYTHNVHSDAIFAFILLFIILYKKITRLLYRTSTVQETVSYGLRCPFLSLIQNMFTSGVHKVQSSCIG